MRSVFLIPSRATALAACGGGSAKQAAAFNLQAGFTNLVRSGEVTSVPPSGNVIVGGVTSAGQAANDTSSATDCYSTGTLTLVGESTANEHDVAVVSVP